MTRKWKEEQAEEAYLPAPDDLAWCACLDPVKMPADVDRGRRCGRAFGTEWDPLLLSPSREAFRVGWWVCHFDLGLIPTIPTVEVTHTLFLFYISHFMAPPQCSDFILFIPVLGQSSICVSPSCILASYLSLYHFLHFTVFGGGAFTESLGAICEVAGCTPV